MKLQGNIGDAAMQDVLKTYPEIGLMLERFDIGCVTCKVGICLLKDVVSIHGLSKEAETKLEEEINGYLAAAMKHAVHE